MKLLFQQSSIELFSLVVGNFNNSIVQHVLVYFRSTKNTIKSIIIKTELVSYCYKRGFCEIVPIIVLEHVPDQHNVKQLRSVLC